MYFKDILFIGLSNGNIYKIKNGEIQENKYNAQTTEIRALYKHNNKLYVTSFDNQLNIYSLQNHKILKQINQKGHYITTIKKLKDELFGYGENGEIININN